MEYPTEMSHFPEEKKNEWIVNEEERVYFSFSLKPLWSLTS